MAKRQPKQYALDGVAGLVQRRKAHSTGTTISIYNNEQADLDTEGGPWSTVCEDHGTIIAHTTITLAKDMASCPEEWCEDCMQDRGRRG